MWTRKNITVNNSYVKKEIFSFWKAWYWLAIIVSVDQLGEFEGWMEMSNKSWRAYERKCECRPLFGIFFIELIYNCNIYCILNRLMDGLNLLLEMFFQPFLNKYFIIQGNWLLSGYLFEKGNKWAMMFSSPSKTADLTCINMINLKY